MAEKAFMPRAKMHFHDDDGKPLSGGKVYMYEPGTTDDKDSYSDLAGTPNTNPVILDARGEAVIIGDGTYKVNVEDSLGNQITGYPVDNWQASGVSGGDAITEWVSPGDTVTYISATQFSVPDDKRTTYQVGRRLKITVTAGTVYGVVTVSSFAASITTVTVSLDSGALDAGLSVVDVGILTVTNPSLPAKQMQSGEFLFAPDTGVADAYIGLLTPAVGAYTEGMVTYLDIANANATIAPTLVLSALAAKTIKKGAGGDPLDIGDLPVGHKAVFMYDGTDQILLNPATSSSIPAGVMNAYGGTAAPSGWVLCDGTAISRTTYATLFGVLGTAYGVGDGSTTFNVPDIRGRYPLGKDDMGGASADRVTATEADNLGQSEGAEDHTLVISEMPAHTHIERGNTAGAVGKVGGDYSNTPVDDDITTASTGGGGAHNNMPPYQTVNYIIKT